MRRLAVLALTAHTVAAADANGWQASLQQAVSLHQAGDLKAACGHYKAAIDGHEPLRSHWAILTNFALAQQPESPAEAAATFERVIELQPSSADAYFNLGTALSECADLAREGGSSGADRLESAIEA